MALVSLGDMTQTFLLRRQNLNLKTEIATLSREMTTGIASDPVRHVGGSMTPLSAIVASITQLDAYRTATREGAVSAAAQQVALTAIGDIASDMAGELLANTTAGAVLAIDAIGSSAARRFDAAVAALNTRLGERSLFAGVVTDGPAVVSASAILDQLELEIAGAVSASDVETAVEAWFDNPSGYPALGYLGGDPLSPLPIAPGQTAELGVTAADPALVDTLKGLAMAALLDRGVLGGQAAGRVDLARRAGERLMATAVDRTNLAAGLGALEAQIEEAAVRNEAERMALQKAHSDLIAIDPYETTTRLEEARTHLETLYAVTARMSRLSLVDFLR